ncbi:hypothetical protein CASFOL_040960 [Castilleja foliolosa]|uniref:Uncharacterized protein n=1 Tax=Castilleja foliolosa TaxID=1961234 RepID=A0ABD3BDG5_9LAMI
MAPRMLVVFLVALIVVSVLPSPSEQRPTSGAPPPPQASRGQHEASLGPQIQWRRQASESEWAHKASTTTDDFLSWLHYHIGKLRGILNI